MITLTGTAKPMPAEFPDPLMMAVLTPDETSCRINQRAAGIARIDGRIGLNGAHHFPACSRRKAAVQSADNACGQGPRKSKRIADGENRLADLQIAAAAHGYWQNIDRDAAKPHHRQVVVLGATHIGGLYRFSRIHAHLNPLSALDDMKISNHMAVAVP